MLEEQCKSWMGITSVAVYWPLIFFQSNNTENLEGAKVTVHEFHQRMEVMGELPALLVQISSCTCHCALTYAHSLLSSQGSQQLESELR